MSGERARAIRDDDPLASWPSDRPIPVKLVGYETVKGAGKLVASLANWGFFEGALLAVGLQRSTEEGRRLEGSAVMIAPGLAVTATHVFLDAYDDLKTGKQSMALHGIRSDDTMDAWKVENITFSSGDDMALLSVALMSAVHDDWFFSTFPLTTRTVVEGELITIVGFREEEKFRSVEVGEVSTQTAVGDMYIAQGVVGQTYPAGRDSLLMPFPNFEVLCGSVGAMSGGAVLDRSGKLVGIITRGWDTETKDGPTSATIISELLARPIELAWPPGMYDARLELHEIDRNSLHIEGRDKLVWDDGSLCIEDW